MMFVSGDMHRYIDISKLDRINELTNKPSTVLIAGDFGGIWNQGLIDSNGNMQINYEDDSYAKSFAKYPFKIICCLGNHENYDVINKLPRQDAYGGKIIRLTDNVELLDRGYVFQIEGKKILSIGGAMSMDRAYRKEHISFWKEETISDEDIKRAQIELSKHDYKVDYVLTHTAPLELLKATVNNVEKNSELRLKLEYAIEHDPSVKLLEEIRQKISFKEWYFGHFHADMNFNSSDNSLFYCLFNKWKELS